MGRLFLLGTVEWVVGTVVPTRDGCSDLGRLCLLGTVVLELTQGFVLVPNRFAFISVRARLFLVSVGRGRRGLGKFPGNGDP